MTHVIWVPRATGGGPASTDHFAPRIIVGNVLAGDPAAAQAAPFQYIGDPGDGSGIQAALAALAGAPGWIHIRRGSYDMSTGAVTTFQVPDGVRITGDGSGSTFIFGRTNGNQRVFYFEGSGSLQGVGIDAPIGDAGATGFEVILVDSGSVDFEDVEVFFNGNAEAALRCALRVALNGVATLRRWRSDTASSEGAFGINPFLHLYAVEGVPGETPQGAIRGIDVTLSGGDIPLLVGGTFELTDVVATGHRSTAITVVDVSINSICRLANCSFTSSGAAYAGVSGIRADAPFGAVFDVRSSTFTKGTALASGEGIIWGIVAQEEGQPDYPGPVFYDVAFDNYEIGARFVDGTTTRARFDHVAFTGCLVGGVLVEDSGASNEFRFNDLHIEMNAPEGALVIGLQLGGDDHVCTSAFLDCVPTDLAASFIGIQISGGQRTRVSDSVVRCGGSDGGSSGIFISGDRCSVTDTRVEAATIIGGPVVHVSAGSSCTLRGNDIIAAAVTPTNPFLVATDFNTLIGNHTLVDTTTVAGIAISVGADNNTVVGNVLQGSTDAGFTNGVDNAGAANELSSNTAPA